MNYVADVRLILLKRGKFSKRTGYDFYSVNVIHQSHFTTGFECVSGRDYSCRSWVDEVVEMMHWEIEEEMKDKPHGFYEMIGQLYQEGWQDYFGEYDSREEFRNVRIQSINYNQATCYDEWEWIKERDYKFVDGSDGYYENKVNPLMEVEKIYRNFARMINSVIGQFNVRFNANDMTVEEVKDFYTMCLLTTKMNSEENFLKLTFLKDTLDEVLKERNFIFTDEVFEDEND